MYCKKCGKEIDDDAIYCPGCGAPTENYVSSVDYEAKHQSVATSSSSRNGVALAGFICSVASLVFGGIIVAIVGLCLCAYARKREDQYIQWNGFIKPGIIVGICSIALYVVGIIVAIAVIAALA